MKTETPSVKIVAITADEAGQRIDNFLRTQLKGVPKSMIYRILRKGEVRGNKKRIKPEYKLEAGDVLKGDMGDVQHFADDVIAQRGVRHGHLQCLPKED